MAIVTVKFIVMVKIRVMFTVKVMVTFMVDGYGYCYVYCSG